MALSPDEKFIYVNPDTTPGEYNTAQYFPVKYLRGLECANAAHCYLYFRGPKDAYSTRVQVSITSGKVKEFFTQFTDEVNFGEASVITLADRNIAVDSTTGGTDFTHVNAFVVPSILSDSNLSTYEDVQVVGNLDIGGSLQLDLVTLSAVQKSTESFADNDTSLMTSAAIDDRINAAAGGVTADPFSTTVIKVLPNQWVINDDAGRPLFVEDDTSNTLGVRCFTTTDEMYAWQKLPSGYKATHVQVHASASTSSAVSVRSYNYQTGADNAVSATTGDLNTNIDITDIPSSATQDLVIKVSPASGSTIIYGATVTIATI
tara:strand:+ start:1291 stop:2244 length:954 start_codon:yes stop_codon:yes gene_type:complete